MRTGLLGILTAFPLLAQFAGEETRVFHLAHAAELQELAIGVRNLGEIRELAASPERRIITIKATAEKLALAEWIIRELDRPAPPGQSYAPPEHKIPGVRDDTVRVIYLRNVSTPQHLQEMAVNVRTAANIRSLFTSTPLRALALRAPESHISFAVWLAKSLDAPPSRATQQYRFPGVDEVAQVSYLREDTSPQALQEMAVNIRTMASIRILGVSNAQKVVWMRGTAQQVELGAWLIEKLDPAPIPGATVDWGSGEDVVRIHFLRPAGDYRRLQEVLKQIRVTGMRYAGVSAWRNAVILRGNAAQLAEAQRIVAEIDR